jgi:tetratricopeptide (TPR) repeat protein
VNWDDLYREDRGDGALILVPPDVPKDLLVGEVFFDLAAALDRRSSRADPATRMRLRVAVHAGEIHQDEHGVVGDAITHAFRLLDAKAARSALRASDRPMVLIASDWFFGEVIRHCSHANPDAYRPVWVSVKQTRAAAWVCLPEALRSSAAGDPALNLPGRMQPELMIPRQLPAAVRDFVGRADELDMLTQLLEDSGGQSATMVISAITGTAGVGKTALAVHWAQQVRDRFPDGDLFLNLHGYGPGERLTADQALETILRALGVAAEKIPAEEDAKAATYRSLLTGRRILVVLDNAAESEQVRPLLPGTVGCVIVVTSRNRLSGLVVSDGAHRVDIDRLLEAEAVTLLRQIIGSARVDNERDAAVDIIRSCASLPLALRIAAERVAARPHLTLAEVVADLADEHRRLDMLDTDDPHTAVRAVFSWSYCALPADLARAFRLLGLHPGPDFGLQAAAAILDTIPATARRMLDRLTGVHLLEEVGRGRYRFHDLLRCYAAEAACELETDQDRTDATRRMFAWYLRAADDAKRFLLPQRSDTTELIAHLPYWPPGFTTSTEALDWCETERVNIVAAVRRASETGHHDLAWRLSYAFYAFIWARKYWVEWLISYEIALSSARHTHDRIGEALILMSLEFAYSDLGESEKSVAPLQTALEIFRDNGYRSEEGVTLVCLGRTYCNLGRFKQAIYYCQQGLIILRDTHPVYESLALIALGYACGGIGRCAEAADHFQAALAAAGTSDKQTQGWALQGLGYAYRRSGRYEKAIHHSRRAFSLFRERGDLWGQGETLYNLGKAQHHAGHHDAAQQSLTKALVILEDVHIARAATVRAYLQSLR